MEFAIILKKFRTGAKISQSALAKAIKMNQSHFNRIERGIRNPPKRNKVLRIAQVLELDEIQTRELMKAAGYALLEVYHSPVSKNELISLLKPEKDKATSQAIHPVAEEVIKELYEVLTDGNLSLKRRLDIAKQVKDFA